MKPKKAKKGKPSKKRPWPEEDKPLSLDSALDSALSSGRSKVVDSIPSLYKEDLGTEGIKPSSVDARSNKFQVKLTKAERRRRKERQGRFGGASLSQTDSGVPDGLSGALTSDRTEVGFASGALTASRGRTSNRPQGKLTGTCQNLEKPYFRLTTFPKVEDVRPLPVLRKSLEHVKSKYLKEEDFEWANEQFKSIRQDLTVQNLKIDFVLTVYETHARLLLEHGDLPEFHQCQTMIQTLTGGKEDEAPTEKEPWEEDTNDVVLKQSLDHRDEFHAYRLLYSLVQNQPNLTMGFEKEPGPSQQHAQSVVLAVLHNDYKSFFRLYGDAPHLSAYLMDFLVQRVRLAGLERVLSAYRPTISVEYLQKTLGFPDLEETRRFLRKQKVVYVKNEKPKFWIDCKASCLKQRERKR